MNMQLKPRALLSVFDKSGIDALAHFLVSQGFEILSTGGTAKLLRNSGIDVVDVSEVTGHPECFEGRVKTLHPAIHAPLLARYHLAQDVQTLEQLSYLPIHLVVVNLYDFVQATKSETIDEKGLLEMIDIGGPTLIRASAKNHQHVLTLTSPNQYSSAIEHIQKCGIYDIPIEIRRNYALEAFQHTADYDIQIANTLHQRWIGLPEYFDDANEQAQFFPRYHFHSSHHFEQLRYGENAHQSAALYLRSGPHEKALLTGALVEGGKAMSYNNYADADACLRLSRSLATYSWSDTPHSCVIVKHNNPCGAALGKTQLEAYQSALASDPESAFGSIICFNQPLEYSTAEALTPLFIEVLMAPGWDSDAKSLLMKKSNRRLLTLDCENEIIPPLGRKTIHKPIDGGWLVQTEEPPTFSSEYHCVVTNEEIGTSEKESMIFGSLVCEQVKSNAIILIQGLATVGIGPGQTSRVEAVRIAARRAGERAKNSILVSDAFFPFKDGIEQAGDVGVKLVIQPGGSIRDQEVIDEARHRGISMVFTNRRLFRH